LFRSSKPDLSTPCAQWTTSGTTAIDPSMPPPGGCYFYLVRALAPHLGSWGQASDGTERSGLCRPRATLPVRGRSRPRSRSARLHPDR
jgi:hypothetical protein